MFSKKRLYLSRCSVFLSFTGVRFRLAENSHRFSLSNESALGYLFFPDFSETPYLWRKVVPKFSFIFLQNLTNHLHERQKVGSARRVTSLAGSPSFDGRVPLRAELTFLHINILASPAGSTLSKRDGKSMRGQLLIRAKGSNSFSCKRSLKLTWQGK